MGTSTWRRCGAAVVQMAVVTAAAAAPIDLTSGGRGYFMPSQSFNETRVSDVTVLNPRGLSVTELRLDRLQNYGCSTRVGARIYDTATGALLAASDAFVPTTPSVAIPIEATLAAGRDYRIGFYVETNPIGFASGGLYLSNPPYVESTGNFRVNHGFQLAADAFPVNYNGAQPHTTLAATVGAHADAPLTSVRLVMRRGASDAAKLELRSDDVRLPFPLAGSPDDPVAGEPGGLALELFSLTEGAGVLRVPRDDAGWRVRPNAYRFQNAAAPVGTTPVRAFALRDGKRRALKVIAKDVPRPLASAQGEVGLRLTMGGMRLCARFTSAGIRRDEPGAFAADASLSLESCTDRALRPAARCGDGACDAGETCDQCFTDCGPCPGPQAPPFLPLESFIDSHDCATLPVSLHAPDPTGPSCWVSPLPFPEGGSADDLIALLPPACCAGDVCGGGVTVDDLPLYVSEVAMTRDPGATFLAVLQGCLAADPPITTFLVPTIYTPDECDQGWGYLQTLVPVALTSVVSTGPDAGITVAPYCGPGMCRFGFCAEGATCETCAWDCYAPPG